MPHRSRRLLAAAATTVALLGMAVAPAHAGNPSDTPDPYTPDVVVAQATPGKATQFPDIIRLADGRLLATYREGVAHSGQDGRLFIVDSADGGRTWSAPRVVVDTPFDERDPKLVQLRDGTILLNYFLIDWTPTPDILFGTFVIRSTDGGLTWSDPVQVASNMEGPSNQSDGYRLGWAATHGAIVELPDGDLLVPLYGTLPTNRRQQATVVRSTDGGQTWLRDSEVVLAAADGIHYQEPVLTVLHSGQVVALIRATDGYAWIARSSDGGHTFTPAERTDMPASSHHLVRLTNGQVLVTYGDLSFRFSPHRETVGRLITHPEGSWDGYRDILLYDSGTGDQANPSSAEVSPGRFLTLSFDTRNHTIVGEFSTIAGYHRPTVPVKQLDLAALRAAGELTVDTDMSWTSAAYPTAGPLGAIDGSPEYWRSSMIGRAAPAAASYTVTFAEPRIVTGVGVVLKPGYRESASVLISPDGISWQQVARYDNVIMSSLDWTTVVPMDRVKAVRVVIDRSDGWAMLAELAISGT